MAKTRLSSKGQVIIPKAVRDRHGWKPGAELEVVDKVHSVVLRLARPFPRTKLSDLFGRLKYHGPPLSVEDMDAAVAREAKRRR